MHLIGGFSMAILKKVRYFKDTYYQTLMGQILNVLTHSAAPAHRTIAMPGLQ